MLKAILFFLFIIGSVQAKDGLLSEEDQSRIAFFTVRHQDIVKKNRKSFKKLLKRLHNNQIVGLELLVAAASKSRIESRFGHTLLRFVDTHGVAGDDIVLSFVADLDGPKLSSRRGVFGGYPVYPLLKSLRMFNKEYVKEDNRSLERHIIPTTEEMRIDLISKLSKWWQDLEKTQERIDEEQSRKAKEKALKKAKKILDKKEYLLLPVKNKDSNRVFTWNIVETIEGKQKIHHIEPVELKLAFSENFGKYKFLSNNCAGALVKFLKKIKFPNRGSLLWAGRIPVKIPTYFEKSLLNPLPKTIIPSLHPLRLKLRKTLSLSAEQFRDASKWPKNSFDLVKGKFSLIEKMKILSSFSQAPQDFLRKLMETLPAFSKRPTYDEIFSLTTFPPILYGTCSDSTCAKSYLSEAKLTWSAEELRYKLKRHSKLLKKIRKGKLKKSLMLRPKVVEHFKVIFLD